MADEVKVLSLWVSMFGLRVQTALELKGIPYEYLEQDLTNKSQLLLESNPVHKKVPVLIHNGKPVCESLIILEYIEEAWKNKGPKLLPEDPYERYVARFWADLVDKKRRFFLVMDLVIKYGVQGRYQRSKLFSATLNKVYDAGLRVWTTEGEEQKKAIQELTDVFILLDDALGKVSKGKPFFGGDEIGFVDVAFGSFACWFHTWETIGGFKLLGEDQCPRLNRFLQAFSEHPAVKKVLPDPQKVLEFAQVLRTTRFLKSS